jgi:hypothetical protein
MTATIRAIKSGLPTPPDARYVPHARRPRHSTNQPFEHLAIDVTCRGNASLGLRRVMMGNMLGVTRGDTGARNRPRRFPRLGQGGG